MMGQEPRPQQEDQIIEQQEAVALEPRLISPEENASAWSLDTDTTQTTVIRAYSEALGDRESLQSQPSTPLKEEGRKTRSLYEKSHYGDERLDRPESTDLDEEHDPEEEENLGGQKADQVKYPDEALGISESPLGEPLSPVRKPESPAGGPQSLAGEPESPVGIFEISAGEPLSPVRKPESPAGGPQSLAGEPESPVGIFEISAGEPLSPVRKPESPAGGPQSLAGEPESPVGIFEISAGEPLSPVRKPESPAGGPQSLAGEPESPVGIFEISAGEPLSPVRKPESPAGGPQSLAGEPESPVGIFEISAGEPLSPVRKPESPAGGPQSLAGEPESPVGIFEISAGEPLSPVRKPESPAGGLQSLAVEPESPVRKPESPAKDHVSFFEEHDHPVSKSSSPVGEPDRPVDLALQLTESYQQKEEYTTSTSPIAVVEVAKPHEFTPVVEVASPSPFVEMMGQEPQALDVDQKLEVEFTQKSEKLPESPSPFVEMMGQEPEPLDLVQEHQIPEPDMYSQQQDIEILQPHQESKKTQEQEPVSESPEFRIYAQHKRESSPNALQEESGSPVGVPKSPSERQESPAGEPESLLEEKVQQVVEESYPIPHHDPQGISSTESPSQAQIPKEEDQDLIHSTSYHQDLGQEHLDLHVTEKFITHQAEEDQRPDQMPQEPESAPPISPLEAEFQDQYSPSPSHGESRVVVSGGTSTPQVVISAEWVVDEPEEEEPEQYTFSPVPPKPFPEAPFPVERIDIEDWEDGEDVNIQESQKNNSPHPEEAESDQEEYVVDSSEVDHENQAKESDHQHPAETKSQSREDQPKSPDSLVDHLEEPEPLTQEDILLIPNASLPPDHEQVDSPKPTDESSGQFQEDMVESEEVVQEPEFKSPSPPIPSHLEYTQEEREFVETESPSLSPLPTQDLEDKDNIFDVGSPSPPLVESEKSSTTKIQLSPQHQQVTLQDVYGTNLPPLPSPLLQSHSAAPTWNKDEYNDQEEDEEDYELVENQDIVIQPEEGMPKLAARDQEEEDYDMVGDQDMPSDHQNLVIDHQNLPIDHQNMAIDQHKLPSDHQNLALEDTRQPSEDILQYKAAELVHEILETIQLPAEQSPTDQPESRESQVEDEDEEEMIQMITQKPASIAINPPNQLGLPVSEELFRPKSPVPPAFAQRQALQQLDSPEEERKGSSDSINIENSSGSSSSVNSLRKHKLASAAADNISEGSLQEFERIEQELGVHRRGSSSAAMTEEEVAAVAAAQSTGSQNSLNEFENLEKEVREAVGAIAEDVMLLSDIREESDEAEEMSTREDEEDEEEEQDSLSGHPTSAHDLQQEHLDALGYDAMLSSVDSLDVARHVAAVAGHGLMDTSVDSLEAGSLPRHARDQSDESGVPISHMEVSSQDTGMSAGTDTTFQEEYEDDKDSLDGVVHAYPTTLTTFETVQMKEDGSTETITRRVITQVTDPVHSRVRFTGTESEDQLRNIQEQQPIESVDEEGNITTTIRRQTIH